MDFFYKFLFFIFLLLSPFIFSFLFSFLYLYIVKKQRFKTGEYSPLGYESKLKRIFFSFPLQFWTDRFDRDPDFFNEYGVHIIAGEQGSGKTITQTFMLRRWQKMYPNLKVKTNYGYVFEDAQINHWKDVIRSENGIFGEIDCLDEIQNWFSSLQSKDFPPEMLTEITQQRKQRKIILATSQVFTRVAKPIREQTTLLYEPITIFGCLTVVPVYKPKMSADGLTDDKKMRRCFFFVHSPDLRDSFDTYRKIESYAKKGFIVPSFQKNTP